MLNYCIKSNVTMVRKFPLIYLSPTVKQNLEVYRYYSVLEAAAMSFGCSKIVPLSGMKPCSLGCSSLFSYKFQSFKQEIYSNISDWSVNEGGEEGMGSSGMGNRPMACGHPVVEDGGDRHGHPCSTLQSIIRAGGLTHIPILFTCSWECCSGHNFKTR